MTINVNVIDALIGSKIMRCRIRNNVTVAWLGQTIGVTCEQMNAFENGKSHLGVSRLLKLANVLEVPIGYFFETSDIRAQGAETKPARLYLIQ